MGFGSPYLLAGLIGAAIPVLIHLYLRNKARRVPMDAVAWLVLSGTGTAARLRTIHALLIAVRVLLIVAVVLLFARPFLRLPSLAGVAAEHPVAFALVLDNSMSMRMNVAGTTSWSRAQKPVLAALREVPPESDVFVVMARTPVEVYESGHTTWGGEDALRMVAKRAPGWSSTDLSEAVRTALDLLRSVSKRDKRLLIASDFFDHGLENFPDLTELAGVGLSVVDVARGVSIRNRAVVDIATTPAPEVSASHVRVRVTIANESADVLEDVLTVRIGQTTTASRVSCQPKERCTHEFLVGVEEGIGVGQASLPPDDLPEDDVRWFTLAPRKRNAVLLVNGAPSRRDDQDESFFLSRALTLRAADGPGFTVTVVRPDEMSPLHLSSVATVGLLNVTRLTSDQARSLAAFVSSGGGLLVTAGDNIDPVAWSEVFSDLLPASIRDVIDLYDSRRSNYPTISWADPDHPAVRNLFLGPGGLSDAVVHGYALLEDVRRSGTTILAGLVNGAPILVERPVGQGTVLTLLTSIDRDWTDLPLRPVFAPFVRQVFGYLTDMSGGMGQNALVVGESRRIDVSAGLEKVLVVLPSGARSEFHASGRFTETSLPGVYRVESFEPDRNVPVAVEFFVVNSDPGESLLRRDGPVLSQLATVPAVPGGEESAAGTRKVWLWAPFLVASLSLLLIEAHLRGKA